MCGTAIRFHLMPNDIYEFLCLKLEPLRAGRFKSLRTMLYKEGREEEWAVV